MAEAEGREKQALLKCQQLQEKVQELSKEQESLHTKHLAEVSDH